ncbi:MAG: hypothetical protein AVDCRST_MAG10-1628 [uncultured Acidimicrobiales bacterium]|uniref:Zinc-finger domain-containing protein n=1 Tax=uncultured Acidimicrobiales bacterium TaxID=310071 RepID=A0A6J4I6F2_9ACTN|nr:MAG: hypothetical protein AVDCRST_MAG10-1628 [uncultured Acidimicrobiales bacterium]
MSLTCAQLEDVAAELALGTVSGAERAAALDHVAGCAACRNLVDQLARAADSLLLLAPEAEPPPGFESRVLSRITPAARPRRERRRRVLVGVAAAALVAGLSGAGVAAMVDDDRRAADIRTALTIADDGRWTCRAVVYGDDPTWLVVSLDRTDDLSAAFSVEAFRSGQAGPVTVGTLTIEQGHGSLATAIQLPAGELETVRVLDARGQVRYTMRF